VATIQHLSIAVSYVFAKSNEKGRYCCVYVATMVRRTIHNV